MRSRLRSRILALTAACAFAFAGAALLDALPKWAIHRTFFADATKTVVVGERYQECDGGTGGWGATSDFVEFHAEACD